jgi:hypothetical protein
MIPVTAIFFSCRRLPILERTIQGFVNNNTYPIEEMIIVNDSGDVKIYQKLRIMYPDYTIVAHTENVGLVKSIDLGYKHIKTEYFFHCEDDWLVTGGGFIEKGLAIMTGRTDIEEVWLGAYNVHPLEEEILETNGVKYRLAKENVCNHTGAWHGFTMALGLKRMSDYKKVAPYSEVPWKGNVWARECAIGNKYHDLGYRTACILEDCAINIGYGQSEYITGYEK